MRRGARFASSIAGRSPTVDQAPAGPSYLTCRSSGALKRFAASTSGAVAAVVRACSSSTRWIDVPTVGLTMNQKNPPTSSSRLAAIVGMTATSLAKIDVDGRSLMPASGEAVADSADGSNEGRMFRVVPELLPNAADEHVDGTVVRLRVHPPHGLHDPIPGQHTPAVSHEQAEQLELGRRQRERPPPHRRPLPPPLSL